MSAAPSISRATFLVFAICLLCCSSGYAQDGATLSGPKISRRAANRTSSGAWLAKCAGLSAGPHSARFFNEGAEWPAFGNILAADPSLAATPDLPCAEPAFSPAPRQGAGVADPCRARAAGIARAPYPFGCNLSEDTVPAELASLGKPGVKIARAREEVLRILGSENACTQWFETKDRNPAKTFQSVNFLLDPYGPQNIFASTDEESNIEIRQPYVARATQDGGAHTAITINVNGAFYRAQGQIEKTAREGGPRQSGGTHLLTVGSYAGDTRPAQTVTLLHEFGHIIGLLPPDTDNLDGKSVRNTDEVLRHCGAEILAQAKQFR